MATVASGGASARAARIGFETPAVVDPIHTFGEPDVGVDPLGRVFVSGPTGTGTQRSVWFGSVDGGHSFRPISPGPPPSAIQSFQAPPGGGDTDIAFDRSAKQYFTDLYALVCLRSATTTDGGATAQQSVFPGGCAGQPGADRQWLAVYDPPPGTPKQSPYTGKVPLVYQVFADEGLAGGGRWTKSTDGLNYTSAQQDSQEGPFGPDGYPAIDQVTGQVLQASGARDADGKTFDMLLNIGTPNADGDLKFLDSGSPGDPTKLVHIADHVAGDPSVLFTVASLDQARNIYVVWAVDDSDNQNPAQRQVFVSASSAASGWRTWTPPFQVSDGSPATGDAVNIFPWLQAGGPGRADAVWYGADKVADPSSKAGQKWNVFMSQVVFPTGAGGAITGAAPSVELVRVSPHPMKYDDVCLQGTGCIQQQGNRNLADFFQVKIDHSGAAEVVYDDTSNGLAQPGFTPGDQQFADHAGAPLVTLARQSSGPGLFGNEVSGPSAAPVGGQVDPTGDALFPVIGGKDVAGLDVLGSELGLSGDTLRVTMTVVDLAHPSQTASAIDGTQDLEYLTRWQMGNVIYYAQMQLGGNGQFTFSGGKAGSVDLCSVSACFPHVITYPEAGSGGTAEKGSVNCPKAPAPNNPCTVTIDLKGADVGSPKRDSLLEEVGTYALSASHPQGTTTNPQAQADNVPLEVDGACCFNFSASSLGTQPVPGASVGLPSSRRCASRRSFTIHLRRGLRRASVFVTGRRVRVIRGRRLRAPVNLRGLPKGRFTVRIVAIRRDGRRVTARRTYHTCVPKRLSHRRRPKHH